MRNLANRLEHFKGTVSRKPPRICLLENDASFVFEMAHFFNIYTHVRQPSDLKLKTHLFFNIAEQPLVFQAKAATDTMIPTLTRLKTDAVALL